MKKVFFALFAVVVAVGGSAFTNVTTGTIYGNTDDEHYTSRTSAYESGLCNDELATKKCAYQVTAAGASTVTAPSYTDVQLANFKTLGYVTELPAIGIYSGM